MSGSSSGAEPRPVRLRPLPAVAAGAHAAFIWWLSGRALGGGAGPAWSFLSNSAHFVLFGVLAILLLEALREEAGWSGVALAAVLALTLAYGAADELHQARVPGRRADAADVCVDLLGSVAATSLWWGVRGPGRAWVGFARAASVGLAAAAFNAWRAWGPLS